MKKLGTIFLIIALQFVFITDVKAKLMIEVRKAEDGYITVKSDEELEKRIKIRIEKGNDKVTCDLLDVNEEVPYALTFGSGKYTIKIFENIEGNRYKVIKKFDLNVNIKNEKEVFLNSNNEVKWNEKDDAIKIARELTKDLKTEEEKIKAIYEYVILNMEYDFNKAETLNAFYKPDIDEILKDKKGICYDYSVVAAAMLRSVGVPTKLVKGYSEYTGDTYHAWNEILIGDKWVVVDVTNDDYLSEKIFEREENKYYATAEY